MESTGKYWIPVFNVLEKHNISVILSHPKYTKPQKKATRLTVKMLNGFVIYSCVSLYGKTFLYSTC